MSDQTLHPLQPQIPTVLDAAQSALMDAVLFLQGLRKPGLVEGLSPARALAGGSLLGSSEVLITKLEVASVPGLPHGWQILEATLFSDVLELLGRLSAFLEDLPRDLGRGSLNGARVQLLQKVTDPLTFARRPPDVMGPGAINPAAYVVISWEFPRGEYVGLNEPHPSGGVFFQLCRRLIERRPASGEATMADARR